MNEEWRLVEDVDEYEVSDRGRVANVRTKRILKLSRNSEGIATVGLMVRGKHTTRSVALLVSQAFIPKNDATFNSPINLDGNRMNCSANNLMWRPRWFAVRYHQQFLTDEFYERRAIIEIEQTGEMFVGWAEPSMTYGLRYTDIILSYVNGKPTFPTMYNFRLVRN